MAAIRKKRVSKKNKSSWRKNVDVTDVENFLEEQRHNERLGGKVQDKKNEDLFVIDSAGDQNNAHSIDLLANKSVRKSLRVKEQSSPKCYSLLERRSAVPDPLIKRNHIRQREKIKKIATNIRQQKRKQKKEPINQFRDIWNEKDTTAELNGLSDWLTPEAVRHTLHNTGHKTRKVPGSLLNKPSPVAAVEAPHPGMSYNPSLADHKKLIEVVAETEAATERKEAHIARVTTKMFRKVPVAEAEKTWMAEMSVGLVPSSDSEDSDAGDYSTVNPPVQRKKKTLQKRRKLKEEQERRHQLQLKKIEKKKRADVNDRLDKLEGEIKKKEKLSELERNKRIQRLKAKETATKTLGPTKFEQPLLEFQSPSELKGSLRKLAPEGSILKDRYASLQRRNVIEPTQRRNVRKAKIKRFVKASHKMGWEPKGY